MIYITMQNGGFCPNGYTDYLSRTENTAIAKNRAADFDVYDHFKYWCDLPAKQPSFNGVPWYVQKSFYGKAKIFADCVSGWFILISYNTPVLAVNRNNGDVVRLWDDWSATTAKHVKAFDFYFRFNLLDEPDNLTGIIRQFGELYPVNKKDWINMPVENIADFTEWNDKLRDR